VGENSATFAWAPEGQDAGTYAILLQGKGHKEKTGEVTW